MYIPVHTRILLIQKKTSYEINNKVFGVLIKNIEQENNSFGVVNTNHTFLINGGL